MPTVSVVDATLDDEKVRRLVARRDVLPAVRHLLRIAPPRPEPRGHAYWPIALVKTMATVKVPFRQPFDVRVAGAVDTVTGRCGLVDVDLPDRVDRDASADIVIEERFDDAEVRARWREYFRNHVVRQYRPSRIDRIEVVELEYCHLPYRVVVDGGRVYLVDELVRRVDPVDQLRHVDTYLTASQVAVTA